MSESAAPVLYGKYQLLELLARGGMAEVFKAKSHGVEGFEKILVIKRILPELSENPRFVEMFINEAKIAVSLSHANIVQVFDLGRADAMYFIAMEYVAGYDLASVLSRGRQASRPMPQELAVYVVSELAKGLDYAHRRRDAQLRPLHIVHRDVSPQNVLISFEGEVKLTDFGIAKAALAVEERTEAGVLKGKYAYMSPEQSRGDPVDARTDLFALGVVLYELLTGQNPFYVAESTYETLRRVRDGDFEPIEKKMPHLPEELAAIVNRALSRDREMRHPNAASLYEELVQFLYSSGRRVGGHDLSDYLAEVRRASEAAKQSDDSKLRAVFDQGAGTDGEYQPDATPVEVPRSGPRRSARPRRSSSSISTRERRDVTALVLRSAEKRFVEDPLIGRMISRFGGKTVDYEPTPGSPPTRVALFGVRDPDGRDTEAAARCGLRIVRSARTGTQTGRPGVPVQVGIHGGRMLVTVAGEPVLDESFDQLAERAREVCDRAALGTVCVSSDAHRVIAGLFVTSPTTEAAKAPYVVEDERSLADASGKFIGRRDELRRVGELLAAANRARMKVIGITGDAGTGKTRLLLETQRRLQLGGHDVGMYVAGCARQGKDVPLAAVQELLRAILGIDELESNTVAVEKVGRLRELGLGGPEINAITVTLGLDPEEKPEGEGAANPALANPAQLLRPALARIALKLAEDRLTVLAWDSAENMDEESQAILDGLIRDIKEARIAVVLAYRPGFEHRWTDVPTYFELCLGPMSDDDVARLTGTRLAAEEVPLELLREVTGKSGGNPLYVEEYLKALADAGAIQVRDGRVRYDPQVAEVEVPKTLRGIVSSRLARLTPTHRHILQIAAVAQERFPAEMLGMISEEPVEEVAQMLEQLEERGLLRRSTTRGDRDEYDFAHELVGEVLRDGLTLDARRELHEDVAHALETLFPKRLDELAERLAHHHREAGARERATDYMVRAADRLEAEHALPGAVSALEKAIDLLSQMATPDRDRMIELYQRIGELAFRSRDLEGGADQLAAGVDLAQALSRKADVARLSMLRGRLLVNLPGSSEEGRRWLDQAGQLARRLSDRRLLRDVVLADSEADMRIGEHGRASTNLSEALDLSKHLGDVEAQIRCLVPLALATASDGRREEALTALDEARKLQEGVGDRFTECEMLKIEGLVHFFGGDYEKALDASAKARELALEYGFAYEAAVNAHNMGEGYLRLGDYKRAFSSLRYSYEVARDHGWEKLQWGNMRVLGFIDATRFGSQEGRSHVVQANEYAEAHGFVWDLIQGRYYLAIIDQGRGDEEAATNALREVLRLAADHGHADYVRAAEKGLKALEQGSTLQLPG